MDNEDYQGGPVDLDLLDDQLVEETNRKLSSARSVQSDNVSVDSLGEIFASLTSSWENLDPHVGEYFNEDASGPFAEDGADKKRLANGRHAAHAVAAEMQALTALGEQKDDEFMQTCAGSDEVIIIEANGDTEVRPLATSASNAPSPTKSWKLLNFTQSTEGIRSQEGEEHEGTHASLNRSFGSSSTLSSLESLEKPLHQELTEDCSETYESSTLGESRRTEVLYDTERVEI